MIDAQQQQQGKDDCDTRNEPSTTTTTTTSNRQVHVFVPGRVCLFGEHSDWAGQYRAENTDIPVGLCIISGTHQGLYARAAKDPFRLKVHCRLDNGREDKREFDWNDQILLKEAQEGQYWSYVCGVAYHIKQRYPDQVTGGMWLDNYKTTLPVKKGLSSSAAVCVLTARAFGQLYGLDLSIRDEMELAHLGETTTPSKCGRMDQGCAYGTRPILMKFDGNDLHVDPLQVTKPIHLILVDLKASKDTPAILRDLQSAYPTARTNVERGVQELLGSINHGIMDKAMDALQRGCAESVGQCMTDAQELFDRYAMPASPEHLESPVLHRLLREPKLQAHVYGGKGVGAQGDGSAQFVAKSKQDREAAIGIIEGLGMACLSLTLGGNGEEEEEEEEEELAE